MIPTSADERIKAGADDDRVGKVFMALADDMRRCLICERVFSRRDSFEHTKFPCHPPAPTAN